MTIEEEIKQTKGFKNVYEKLCINLMFTNNWMVDGLKIFFKKEHVTPQQYNILRILRGSNLQPLSTLQIRERMIEKMSDTSRIVDRLVVKKLVSKKINLNDKRLVDVRITPKGLHVLERLDSVDDYIEKLLSNISQEEAAQLNIFLDKLHDVNINELS